MPEKVLDKGTIAFQAEGRLLQELGLRLVASPEVALVELIKNAYDADSPLCTVHLQDDDETLVVHDTGHGITLEDFLSKWMRIATSSKLAHEFSPKFHRRLTGAKGIGRFAVRYLGDHLQLDSDAYDKKRDCMARLTALFDWPKLDEVSDLSKVQVDYRLVRLEDDAPSGTTLRITKLRSQTDFVSSRQLRDSVLRMVSPLQGLDWGRFATTLSVTRKDPGFKVVLPGESEAADVDLAKLVLDHYWARLTIHMEGNALQYQVFLSAAKKPRTLSVRVQTTISNGFFADIRYFPRRKGVFSGMGVHGQKAWRWVRDNCGVAVVDHGFRIKPYGFANDDWLTLDIDKAHNERDWRTAIAKKYFPVSSTKRGEPADNPVLYLPYNFQLVGAVFIESKRRSTSDEEKDLVPAMDREGLLANIGAKELQDFVRAGIEFLAHEDKAELERLAMAKAKEATRTARDEIQQAIKHIERSPTLVASDKARIVKQYRHLADRVDEQEEYSEQSRRSSMTMGLLGVVAGFMTHESKAAVHDLEQAATQVRALAKKHSELADIADDLSARLQNFQGYLDYARMFVRNVRTPKEQPLPAAGQIRHILNNFKTFADDRGIEVSNEVASDVMTPPLPVTVYSGVLLNLYTNALKAVIAAKSSLRDPRICFRAWNEKKRHVVEVADNGIGIPPEIRKRIWDPLYTTTSDVGNPLGSGMGLGLTLVKQVAEAFDGTVSLVSDPPPGFTTCFRVEFPSGSQG
jgi:signal transduction histidine kinase